MEFENQVVALVVALVALWVVAIGFGLMLRGRQGGAAVFVWPLHHGLRLIRWTIGTMFILLGNMIRGLGEIIRG